MIRYGGPASCVRWTVGRAAPRRRRVASALLGRHRGGKLSNVQLDDAREAFTRLPIHRSEHRPLLPRIRERHANVSAYDAIYVALAEAYEVPLITSDGRLTRSGRAQCKVEVFDDNVSGAPDDHVR